MDSITNVDIARDRFNAWLAEKNLPVGAKLPSERELCDLLGTRRMTLRQVLLGLELDMEIFRKNRVGWFLTPPKFIYDPKLLSGFSKEAELQGRIPKWEYLKKIPFVIQIDNIPLPFDNASKVTGWCGLDGHKVFYHETFIDNDFAPDYVSSLMKQSFTELWDKGFSQELTIQKLTFRPINMPIRACKQLAVAPNSMGVLIERHRGTKDKKIVQVDFEYWRIESVELVINDL